MRSDQAKTIPIHEYLSQVEGIYPAHSRRDGRELWYKSPIREDDNNPSFKIDTEQNLWVDYGTNEGGKIIDLVCKIRNASVKQALAILEQSGLYSGSFHAFPIHHTQNTPLFDYSPQAEIKRAPASEKEKNVSNVSYIVLKTCELQHPALWQYLQSRSIDVAIASSYLEEVYFKPAHKQAEYYAIGWKNGGGYDVRNKLFKGFAGTGKTLSTFNLEQYDEWLVFEGFMDYLSYLTLIKQQKKVSQIQKAVVVLNSIVLKKQLLLLVEEKQPKTLYFFLDNDEAGGNTIKYFQNMLTGQKMLDMRHLYSKYKDVNDWLCKKPMQ